MLERGDTLVESLLLIPETGESITFERWKAVVVDELKKATDLFGNGEPLSMSESEIGVTGCNTNPRRGCVIALGLSGCLLGHVLVNSDTSMYESRARARMCERAFEENFKEWYQHYPRKVSRGAAEKALERVLADGVSLETLIEAAKH